MAGYPVAAVTHGPKHHSFGYYDKCPWDVSGRYLLALEAPFCDRSPEADEAAVLGVVDLENDRRFLPFAETRAWNWQQGTMLHWLRAPLAFSPIDAGGPDTHLAIFNERDGDHFISIICDGLSGREVRRLPLPIYALAPDGRQAVTINFSRLHHQRRGYGYAGVPDRWEQAGEPDDDGIYWLDTETGDHRLVITIAQLANMRRKPGMDGAIHRFNHLQFNPDGSRFVFLHRWKQPGAPGAGLTRLCAADPDGSNLAILADEERVSHFDWRDPRHVLAWARYGGEEHFFLYEDPSGEAKVVGPEAMPRDGHCSYSPDPARRWILNDTYPDAEQRRGLYLYDTRTGERIDVGRFYSPPELKDDYRVDLHPRWSRDGRQVCFDSAHEGSRQLYVADVAAAGGDL
jgi:hypothetical protein